jgi:hypothetical protein
MKIADTTVFSGHFEKSPDHLLSYDPAIRDYLMR